MLQLLHSPQFWFGAVLIGGYQFKKFAELSSLDAPTVPSLRTIDFAGKPIYCAALAAFMAVTFSTYLLLCSISPEILLGWAKVSGAPDVDSTLREFVGSDHYPIYIAAAFLGVTQSGIPLLSKIGDIQRNFFHGWMGVPRRVMRTSSSFYNQILARSPARTELGRELQFLIGDAWVDRMGSYADSGFYRDQISRLKLDDPAEVKVVRSSLRELKTVTRQLVDVATVATVRESGATAIRRLADDLRVTLVSDPDWSKAFLPGVVLFAIGMTVLWVLIPLFHGAVLLMSTEPVFWPEKLEFSSQFVVSQGLPVFLAATAMLTLWVRAFNRTGTQLAAGHPPFPGIVGHFQRYSGHLATIVVAIVLFDVLQAFFDLGFYQTGKSSGFLPFIRVNFPFYLLHSLISVCVCFWLLLYMDGESGHRWASRGALFFMVVSVSLISFFYVVARISLKFGEFGPVGFDLAILMVVLNAWAATLAFASAAFCKRQAMAWRDGTQEPIAPAGADPVAIFPRRAA